MRDDHEAVVEIDDGQVFRELLGGSLVGGHALGHGVLRAGLFEGGIYILVGISRIVVRGARAHEGMDVSIRVRAARPGEHIGLVIPGFRFLQRGREFRHADLHLETGFRRHGLHHLGHLARFGVVRHHEVHGNRVFTPASASSFFALATSRFGTGTLF